MQGIWLDPEGTELATLDRMISLRGRRVIEIGCGEGRFTMRLARRCRHVVALDPDRQAIARARRVIPPPLKARTQFKVAWAESLPFPDQTFDVAVLSWSL